VQSTRLADPFEPWNSSLAQSTEDLGRWTTENCCFLGRNRSTNILYDGSQCVKGRSGKNAEVSKK